ncbi:ribosomal protein S8e [Vararia minispora EC-137]|uniref:Ribosomal protein S8e n=1 Tax=Vararia minispora EC-137 TaxID=1314806 RepID=A0ACB8QKW8_9AGAM|nr:ribosomal protein S8e [Vararia minispora EC-137]
MQAGELGFGGCAEPGDRALTHVPDVVVDEPGLKTVKMGISRTSRHKRSATGAQRAHYRKKRKFELGRQSAQTRLGAKRIHTVRVRGGNLKYRALRLDSGNFAWASEHCTRKTRIIGVVYNASNNELVRTNTLVKSAIIQVDAAPFRQWYEAHYAQPVTKRGSKAAAGTEEEKKKVSNHVQRKQDERKKDAKVDQLLETQFAAGRLYAAISSRPGQCGRADGYILEGKELEFYLRKLRSGKQKHG